jgi:hypothetical protein
LTETPSATRPSSAHAAGVAKRKIFYGGAETACSTPSTSVCSMRGVALTETDANGRAMYEYLV